MIDFKFFIVPVDLDALFIIIKRFFAQLDRFFLVLFLFFFAHPVVTIPYRIKRIPFNGHSVRHESFFEIFDGLIIFTFFITYCPGVVVKNIGCFIFPQKPLIYFERLVIFFLFVKFLGGAYAFRVGGGKSLACGKNQHKKQNYDQIFIFHIKAIISKTSAAPRNS